MKRKNEYLKKKIGAEKQPKEPFQTNSNRFGRMFALMFAMQINVLLVHSLLSFNERIYSSYRGKYMDKKSSHHAKYSLAVLKVQQIHK